MMAAKKVWIAGLAPQRVSGRQGSVPPSAHDEHDARASGVVPELLHLS